MSQPPFPITHQVGGSVALDLICMFWRAGTLYWAMCCQLFKCQTITCENYVTVGVSHFSMCLNDACSINFWNVRVSFHFHFAWGLEVDVHCIWLTRKCRIVHGCVVILNSDVFYTGNWKEYCTFRCKSIVSQGSMIIFNVHLRHLSHHSNVAPMLL
jgi:hypothetical protein